MDIEEQYDKIYRYCYMKVKHRQIAEDITQETFLRFIESRGYRDMGKELAYLYTISRNLCADHYRKCGYQEVACEESALKESGNWKVKEQGQEEQIVDRILLEEALLVLTEEEREIVFFRYVNELSAEAIGKILGISRFRVYRRINACMKKLKDAIERKVK